MTIQKWIWQDCKTMYIVEMWCNAKKRIQKEEKKVNKQIKKITKPAQCRRIGIEWNCVDGNTIV